MTPRDFKTILNSTTSVPFTNTTIYMGGVLALVTIDNRLQWLFVNLNSKNSKYFACPDNDSKSTGLTIGLTVVVVLLFLLAAIGCTYMYRTKRMFRVCDFWNRQRRRRLSSGSSQRALDDDGTSIDIPGSRREANLFSIDDEEPNRDDGYFYDEVFERSAFVDEKTNASLKQLYIPEEVPDLDFREQRY